MKCELTEEINHNTDVPSFLKIAENGSLKIIDKRRVLGQDAISLSSCPAQTYGGNVKLVFNSEGLLPQLRASCYVDFSWKEDPETGKMGPGPYGEVDKGMSREAQKEIDGLKGDNRVRAQYAVQPSIYTDECEYLSYDDIKLKDHLKRVEFWIPWKIGTYAYTHDCDRSSPKYANVHGHPTELLGDDIQKVKWATERLGRELERDVDFDVKSCFTALKVGWGDKHIALTDENLEKIKDLAGQSAARFRDELLELSERGVPQECIC